MTRRLEGRTAIVTGASSGIGRAIARRYAAEGARVVVADVRAEPLEGGEPTLVLIERAGAEAISIEADVSVAADVERLVAAALDRFGCLDVMVNNAAIYTGAPLLETSEADWDRVMAVNLKGVFLGCRAAVAAMLAQAPKGEVRGRIVNVSSQHGMVSCPGDVAYGTSKSGVVYLTRQIAAEYARHGIVCNAVAPGKILTGRTDAVGEDALAYARARTPWPRLGQPGDVASAAVFLASDEASYITGVNLMVDGGWMAA